MINGLSSRFLIESGHPLEVCPVCRLLAHRTEDAVPVLEQLAGRVKLGKFSCRENEDAIVVDDAPQAMRDRDDERVGESFADRVLNLAWEDRTASACERDLRTEGTTDLFVRVKVDARGRFVLSSAARRSVPFEQIETAAPSHHDDNPRLTKKSASEGEKLSLSGLDCGDVLTQCLAHMNSRHSSVHSRKSCDLRQIPRSSSARSDGHFLRRSC